MGAIHLEPITRSCVTRELHLLFSRVDKRNSTGGHWPVLLLGGPLPLSRPLRFCRRPTEYGFYVSVMPVRPFLVFCHYEDPYGFVAAVWDVRARHYPLRFRSSHKHAILQRRVLF